MYRTLNTNKKGKYKNFLHKLGRSWVSEVQDRSESKSNDLQLPEKQTTPRGPKKVPARQPLQCFQNIQTGKKKKLVVGREKRSILQDSVKCVLHIRSKVKLDAFLNSALFYPTMSLVLRNTIH
jgi:hypothetical protein